MRNRQCKFVPAAALLLIAGCVAQSSPVAKPDARVVSLFGGEETLDVVLSAEEATAYRVTDNFGASADDADDGESIGGYPVIAGPVPVDSRSIGELAEVLKDAGTYEWEMAKGCIFQPGVAIRYADESTTVDVLLCFSCDELKILRNGERVGGEDFDNTRGRLVAVAKRLFPDDEEIQSLE